MNYSEVLFKNLSTRDAISERIDDVVDNLLIHRPNIIHIIGSANYKRWHIDSDIISELISKISKTVASNIEILTRKSPIYRIDQKGIITDRDLKRSYHKYIDSDTSLDIISRMVDYGESMLENIWFNSTCINHKHSQLYVCNQFCDTKMYPRDKHNSELTAQYQSLLWYHNLHYLSKLPTDSIISLIFIDVLFDSNDKRSKMSEQCDKLRRINSIGEQATYTNYTKVDLRNLSKISD